MTAMKEGMKKIRLSGEKKFSAGKTAIAEVLRVVPYSGKE